MEDNQEKNLAMPIASELHANRWIEDEGFLRDDGVLFGFSNASPDHKLEAIDHYYQSQIDPIKIEVDSLNGEELRVTKLLAINDIPVESRIKEPQDTEVVYFVRNGIGLLATLGACFFNYFLIAYDLKKLDSGSVFISVGVYLFGLFMIFAPKSILYHYEGESSPTTKSKVYLYLLEFGAPFVSALFVSYVVMTAEGFLPALIHFIFIILLFVIPGKLFLSLLKQVTDDFKVIRRNRFRKNSFKEETRNFHISSENKLNELNSLREKIDLIISGKLKLEKQIAKLKEEKESKKKLFMSEYNLAKAFAAKLTTTSTVGFLNAS